MKALLSLVAVMFFASSVSYAQLICEREIKTGDTVLTFNANLRRSFSHVVVRIDLQTMKVKIRSNFNSTINEVSFNEVYVTKGCVETACVGKTVKWGDKIIGLNRLKNQFIIQQPAGGNNYIYGLEDVL